MRPDLQQLSSFLAEANRSGYAAGDESASKKEADVSTTITYQNGPWLFNDNYFGGEPYGGREVVFYESKPVFMMVYYGRISGRNFDSRSIYAFLQKALKLFPEDKPFRGPESFEEETGGKKMRYENNWQGELENFSGEEKIFADGKEVYDAKYAGGLVDQ